MDQFGRGIDVYVGRRGGSLCPVAAILTYLARRWNDPGPIQNEGWEVLDYKALFTTRLREALSTLWYKAATMAAERGIEDSVIRMLGRWDSSACQLFIRALHHLHVVV